MMITNQTAQSRRQNLINEQTRFEKLLRRELKRIRAALACRYGMSWQYPSYSHTYAGGIIKCGGSPGIAATVNEDGEILRLLHQYHYAVILDERICVGNYGYVKKWAQLRLEQDKGYWNWAALSSFSATPAQPPLQPPPPTYSETGISDRDLPWWAK